jgi:hypothetical protein
MANYAVKNVEPVVAGSDETEKWGKVVKFADIKAD